MINQTEDAFLAALMDSGVIDSVSFGRLARARQASSAPAPILMQQLGIISEDALVKALASYTGLPVAASSQISADYPFADELNRSFLAQSNSIPVELDNGKIAIAMANPLDDAVVAAVSYKLRRPVSKLVAPLSLITATLQASTEEAPASGGETHANDADIEALHDLASGAPVVRFVSGVIERAAQENASDIHFEPTDDHLRIRLRVNGALREIEPAPHAMKLAVTSRLKILARLDIAETRLPQDGRAKINVRGKEIDLRVSTSPTLLGEGVVVRLLDKTSMDLSFPALGFSKHNEDAIRKLIEAPHGLVLVAGPTGSGKTTTLYTSLIELNDPRRKIFSVEDPVEYRISGVSQIQINPKIGLTFATALRSLLRQDPDIMMVGEIRDGETADIAVQSALTGHLVLATIHTNSAAATISRLMDMGVEDYLLSASLGGVVAQRLVGSLCRECAAPEPAPRALLERIGMTDERAKSWRPVGCDACNGSGYMGRTTISEVLSVTPELRTAILERASEAEIEDIAAEAGLIPMLHDGISKALAGVTSIEEVLRAVKA